MDVRSVHIELPFYTFHLDTWLSVIPLIFQKVFFLLVNLSGLRRVG